MSGAGIPDHAVNQFHDKFINSPYIGRAQLWDKEETGLGPHRFFYIGYYDIFGVEMPAIGRKHGVEFQIWPVAWVRKRIKSLDRAVALAMEGDFLKVRHNIQLEQRAKQHGRKFFIKPQHLRKAEKASKAEGDKLPIRKRKRKRKRRALKI